MQVYNQDMRKVILYETAGGKCPVAEFLDSLPSKQAQKAAWVLRLIEELDIVPASYLKKLIDTDEIWEVRVSSGNDIFRLLCSLTVSSSLLLIMPSRKRRRRHLSRT